MTAALAWGMGRSEAARFSFLLSIPVILAATVLQGSKLLSGAVDVQWSVLALAIAVSAATAFATIHWFLKLVEVVGFMPFVIYRCALAAVLFYIWL